MSSFLIKKWFFPSRQFSQRISLMFNLTLLLSIISVSSAFAWPADSQWLELVKGGSAIQDDEGDANGGVNVVPDDGSHAAAYIYNDGTYLYYRLRLDDDPTQGGNGVFAQFGWGFEIDTDQNADDYEWLIMCDGISSPEVISLRENTDKTALGDPSDKAEYVAAEYPLVGNHRLSLADTSINSDQDYFLDYRLPYAVFKAATGITDNSLIRYFAGSSRSTNNLTNNGADLVAGSNLYEMASDYITPFGTLPSNLTFYDGTVRFVKNISGFGDQTLASPGETVYIRADDLDLDNDTNPGRTLVVTVTSPTGDSERVTLTATGVQGKYTGALPTSSAGNSDGTLYILDNQTATVTYVDAVTANRTQSVDRTDSLFFTAPGTDIGITKTIDTMAANEGDTVTFTVTAINNGPSAVTTFSVADTLPAGLTLLSATPSLGSYASGVWTGGALARYAFATLTLQATIDSGTNGSVLTNTAALISSTPTDRYPGNDTDSASVTVGGTDLRITKTVDDPVPTEGGSITYTLRVFNLGPTDTGGIQIQDLLPAGVTYSSDNGGGSYNPGTGLWNVGFLANGDGVLLRINATVDAGTFGQVITNTASLLASDQPDTDPSNNSDSADIKVDFLDLELTKQARKVSPLPPGSTADSITANQGDTVDFIITLDNNGPHDATGVQVTDTLPIGVTYVSNTVSQGTFTSGTGLWDVGTLNDGDTATLTIQVTIDNGTAGQTLLNEAEITAVDQPDSNPGNELDTATVTVDGTDLQVVKSVNNGTPNPADTIVWTIVITNNGPNQATSVEITDILPAGITYVSDTTSQGSYDAGKQNSSWVWTAGPLDVAASATMTITTTVDAGTTGQTIVNTAMITNADQTDPDNSNNVNSDYIAVSGTDLAITKTVDDNTPDLGQNITYTLTATNNGPSNATTVIVNDLLPPEVSYQSDTASQGTYDNLTGIWDIGNLANGASITLDIIVQVLNDDGNLVITNTAIISATEADPDPSNNTATTDINVSATDLAVTKAVNNPTPGVGDTIIYTITLTNGGSNQATNVELEDILPAGVTYVSSTPSQGSFAAGLWLAGTITGSGSASLDITATVDVNPTGTIITNTADITYLDQIDTNDTNDSDSVDITLVTPPDVTLVKMAQNIGSTGYDIPGEIVRYTLIVNNFDSRAIDSNTIILTDPIPANTVLVVSEPAVTVTNPAATGLILNYIAIDDNTDQVEFSTDGSDFSYQPTDGGSGTDSSATHIRFVPTGSMNASSSFTVTFMVRIQ
jgi:uncharacterized repeat protein (TIGR01451 family)